MAVVFNTERRCAIICIAGLLEIIFHQIFVYYVAIVIKLLAFIRSAHTQTGLLAATGAIFHRRPQPRRVLSKGGWSEDLVPLLVATFPAASVRIRSCLCLTS